MTLPASGPISLSQVDVELGRASSASVSLGESATRTLAGVASGPISLASLYGKSSKSANSYSVLLNNTGLGLGFYLATFNLNPDGTCTGGHASSTANWHTPTTTGVGSGYWAKLTTAGFSLTTITGTLSDGAWHQLDAQQTLSVKNSSTGAEGTGNFTIQIAGDSAGASILGAISGSWDVGRVS